MGTNKASLLAAITVLTATNYRLVPVQRASELEGIKVRLRTICMSAFVFATIVAIRPASAACSKATLNGVLGFSYGRLAGPGIPTAVVGQLAADGRGNLSGSWTQSSYGVISTETFRGTYSISNNCTGSMTFNNHDGSVDHFNIVLDDGDKGFQMIRTDNSHTQPGFALPEGTVVCGFTGKQQVLALNVFGTIAASNEPEAIVGELTLDGKGNISGTATLSIDFLNSTAAITGKYTQGTDCKGTLEITPKGHVAINYNTVVVNGGAELLLIETDKGMLVAGTAQQ